VHLKLLYIQRCYQSKTGKASAVID